MRGLRGGQKREYMYVVATRKRKEKENEKQDKNLSYYYYHIINWIDEVKFELTLHSFPVSMNHGSIGPSLRIYQTRLIASTTKKALVVSSSYPLPNPLGCPTLPWPSTQYRSYIDLFLPSLFPPISFLSVPSSSSRINSSESTSPSIPFTHSRSHQRPFFPMGPPQFPPEWSRHPISISVVRSASGASRESIISRDIICDVRTTWNSSSSLFPSPFPSLRLCPEEEKERFSLTCPHFLHCCSWCLG